MTRSSTPPTCPASPRASSRRTRSINATEAALPRYLALAAQPPAVPLPGIGTAKPIDIGGSYPALAPLLARLQLDGDAPAPAAPPAPQPAAPTVYTADLAAAVKHFQDRSGLTDDGKLSQGTIDALNVPMSRHVQQMNDALERWRWLSDDYVQPRLLVNLPEFILRAYEPDHTQAFKMKVVDGQAHGNHDTPIFDRMMRYVVFRPYWNVPVSIIKKEIVPHLQRSGMGYLDRNGYELTGPAAMSSPAPAWTTSPTCASPSGRNPARGTRSASSNSSSPTSTTSTCTPRRS